MTTHDVIIAGASFAGLAVAAQLRGKRVLLLDKKPVGTHPTSACGVPLHTIRDLGLDDAIRQVHHDMHVHTPHTTVTFPIVGDGCTIDYAVLCEALYARSGAEFRQTPVLGLEDGGVRVGDGVIRGRYLVDASGWRGVLARSLTPDRVQPDDLWMGIETVVPHRAEGLHLWYPLGRRPLDFGWIFPAGEVSHVGVARLGQKGSLKPALSRFLDDLGLECGPIFGGAIPHVLRPPIVGDLFVVGDAAGHCLPTTGEGIRPALYFGTHLGRLLSACLEGKMSPDAARAAYRQRVEAHRRAYRQMSRLQRFLGRSPVPLSEAALSVARHMPAHISLLRRYERLMRLDGAVAPTENPRSVGAHHDRR